MLQHFPSVHGALHKNRAGGNTLPEHKGAAQRGKQRDDVANTRRSNKRLPKAASKASARLVNATFRLILSFDQVTPGSLFQVCPKKEKLGPRLLETTWSREARRSGLGLGLEPPAVRRPRLLPGDNLEQGGEAKRTRTRTSRCPLTCLAPYRWAKAFAGRQLGGGRRGGLEPTADLPSALPLDQTGTRNVAGQSYLHPHSEHRFPAPSSKLCQI